MKNNEMMTLVLSRLNVCDLSLATHAIISDMRREMRDPATTDDRREILVRSIEKWKKLHDNIVAQRVVQEYELE